MGVFPIVAAVLLAVSALIAMAAGSKLTIVNRRRSLPPSPPSETSHEAETCELRAAGWSRLSYQLQQKELWQGPAAYGAPLPRKTALQVIRQTRSQHLHYDEQDGDHDA